MTNQSLCIDLGGIVADFRPEDPELELFPVDSHLKFVSRNLPEITILVRNRAPGLHSLGGPRFEGGFWSFYESGPDDIFQMDTRIQGVFPRRDTLIFKPGGDRAELYVEQDLAAAYPELPGLEVPPILLDEMMASSFLSQRSGLHFHACGLKAQDGRGFLFTGYSGSGKSTTARIWRENGAADLLSDERVAVRRQEGRFWLHGTPWHSSLEDSCSPEKAPLERIFILEHAAQNQARRMRPVEAVAALAARSYLPYWDIKGMELTLEFLDSLVQAVPCYQLGFVPNASVIDYIQCLSE